MGSCRRTALLQHTIVGPTDQAYVSRPLCMEQAFVVLGASILGGRSAFVMTTGQASYDPNNPHHPSPILDLDESKLRLWNPLTGVCTSIKDVSAEMRQVGGREGTGQAGFPGRVVDGTETSGGNTLCAGCLSSLNPTTLPAVADRHGV